MEKLIFGITSLTLGGAERVLVDIVNKLADKYEITIFTIYSKGTLEKELDKRIHIKSMYDKTYSELSKKERLIISLNVLFKKRKIYNEFVKGNYKAEIAFLEGPVTRIFSVKNKTNETNKIAWIHNDISMVFGRNLKSKLKRIIDRNAYEKFNKLVFVSRDNQEKFNKVYDDIILPKETMIKNYINNKRIEELSSKKHEKIFNEKEINILQVSRLVEQKAIDRLIRVHAKLINEGIKHHIYIIGDGPLKNKLSNQIIEEKVENTFSLLGAKENPYPYMKEADCIALFSKFEGYPMVLEEAKILKKHIAATNSSAREVLADYKTYGVIVSNDEQGIEQAIKHIVKNKYKFKEKIKYDYTNDKIIDKIEKIINT